MAFDLVIPGTDKKINIPLKTIEEDGSKTIILPSSLVEYKLSIYEASPEAPYLVYASNPTGEEKEINVESDESGIISVIIDREFTKSNEGSKIRGRLFIKISHDEADGYLDNEAWHKSEPIDLIRIDYK